MTDGQWTTYDEAAAALGISGDAIRRRAARGRWARMPGNDGRMRIQVPDDVPPPRRGNVGEDTVTLVAALEAHIATLKTELAGEKERVDRVTAELAGERAAHRDELAAARAAADRATAELVELARRLAQIAETQAAAESAPEPPRRSMGRRALGWFLRN
jgi:hypothetical protein